MQSTSATDSLVPTILCGGAGSRLWPVSREQHPKPLIRINGKTSLLQDAFVRGATLPNVSDILTVTNRELFFKIESEYREAAYKAEKKINTHFILEPFERNTAPAIATACLHVAERFGEDATLLVLAADHVITDQVAFASAVALAHQLAKKGKLVTFGIQPTSPETGYGYIESNGNEVLRFVEKPSVDKAVEYLDSGKFLWNSGMFCFTAGSMLRELAGHNPKILQATQDCLKHSRASLGVGVNQLELNPEYFELIANNSIDYAIMEKTNNAAVVACDIGWSDIGCWRALGNLKEPDSNDNRIKGEVVIIDSQNCTINSEDRLVGVVGIKDLVIVDTADALLVADKLRAQDVKKIYAQLKVQDHEVHKYHRTVHRPWGTYTILEEGLHFKIKRIEVKPGASLSLQMHHRRSEHWVVVRGTAKVLNNEQEFILNISESTFIPAKHKHRLENIGVELLVMIEVQTGDYLGEDDIVRFDDIYGRVACPA
ncbi:MAG: mannose-1-phosphate guanylyltransferase/mannose-6-phosphate isomerase [Sedimenticola sp.]